MKDQAFGNLFAILKQAKPLWPIVIFLSTLFITSVVSSKLSVRQGHKCDGQVADSVDLTVGDYMVYLCAYLSDLPRSDVFWFFKQK